MTPADVASRLGVSTSTVSREIRDGRLGAVRVRGRVVILDEHFKAYVAANAVQPLRIVRPATPPPAPWD